MPGRAKGDLRGNNKDRRRRKEWMLETFGDGTTAPCHWCDAPLNYEAMTVDRHPVCGHDGGRYTRGNVVPACAACNFGRCSKCIKDDASHWRQTEWFETTARSRR